MDKTKKEFEALSEFTNLYSLSKTLRFELKPVGKTLENMRSHLHYDKNLQTFLVDQEIENAYQQLKPIFDFTHEEFITESLESKNAQKIDFSEYLEKYRNKKDLKEKDLESIEKKLRENFADVYEQTAEIWKQEAGQNEKNKDILGEKGFKILTERGILDYIKRNIDLFLHIKSKEEIEDALEKFAGFFTYFGGFNQNRENYYETAKEASTAVATRIVHENLPKFCDNLIQFECITKKKKDGTIEKIERKSEYLNAYEYLKTNKKTTQIKDANNGKMIETSPISEDVFKISNFSQCLSQKGIEEYNRIIGHYNLLINLYNQAKRSKEKDLEKKYKTFKDLPKFKTLWKQIGCGKKDPLFFTLTHDTKAQAQENKEKYKKPYSVEQVLEQAKRAGEKYFQGKSDDGVINTVPEFLKYILEKENYEGVYWSKAAINTISNKYFANYYDLKDRLKEEKVFQKPSKGSEEDVKIPEAIELSGLFAVLDSTEYWKTSMFLKRILEDDKKAKIIQESQSPSEALLKMIFQDIRDNAENFKNGFQQIETACKEYYSATSNKEEKNKLRKEAIKQWFDYALVVNQMLKYFLVKESKAKGLDSEISNALKAILFEATLEDETEINWFNWYDALRKYLTKKPQDDAKENKLKLNFENGSLLNGFVDSHTENSDAGTQYGAYLFRKYNQELEKYEYLLGISQDKKLFRCHLKQEAQKENKFDFQRLEYYQAKSTTFFSEQYSINKDRLVKYLSLKIQEKITAKKNFITDKGESQKIDDLGKKLLKSDTPTGLIEGISKQKDFLDIFENGYFQKLVSETINEITEYAKNYQERATRLKEIQKKIYQGHVGLKNLINDLQTIVREQKEYVYFPISQKEFEDVCNRSQKPLYVFAITNKDLLKKKETLNKEKERTGKNSEKNLHTLYFEKMLAGNQSTFDIGSGKIFYRKKALNEKETKKGYEQKPWVIENKRFTENKELETSIPKEEKVFQGKSFFLHLSLKLNYTKPDKYKSPHFLSFEDFTNTQFSNSSKLHFLGIDRGEKHLAYYCLVDQSGKIAEQGSLNLPFTDKARNPRSIKKDKYFYDKKKDKWESKEADCWNYNDLLDAMASNRDMARKNWQTIGTIKELKAGYISQVVRKIADLATDENHPAFIILEDLNTGFKRERQKIEKSVYQKLEVALAKKLNFLIDKSAEIGSVGSVTNALQLTPPVNNYSDIEKRKQVGIMLYARANYTSQTDPVTGWRKSIYLKTGSEENIKKQILDNFTDIYFDGKDYVLVYTDENTRKEWKLYSGKDGQSLDRFRGVRGKDKNEWIVEKQNIVEILDGVYGVFSSFDKTKSLLKQIKEGKELKKYNEHTAWESLRFAIELIQQIRNTGGTEDKRNNDFILSPTRDENGKHFDSREYLDKEQEELKRPINKRNHQPLPTSGDANGAFNIARKGVLMNAHIQANPNPKDLSLFISDEEWDLYLANHKEWKNRLSIFSSRKEIEKQKH